MEKERAKRVIGGFIEAVQAIDLGGNLFLSIIYQPIPKPEPTDKLPK